MTPELYAEMRAKHDAGWQGWELEETFGHDAAREYLERTARERSGTTGAEMLRKFGMLATGRETSATSEERSSVPPAPKVVSPNSLSSQPQEPDWPVLADAALYGLAGRVMRTLAPETEADPAGLLVSFLVAFGNMAWSPYAKAGAASHPARLNAVLVGDSRRARKGTSWSETSRLLRQAHATWWVDCIVSGLSSGEGLINEVRDDRDDPISGTLGGGVQVRLIHEAEFAHVLKIAGREGNILSTVLRDAWDGRDLRILTRKDPMKATAAHISILAHITAEELRRYLTETDMASGFANRFLFCMVRRSKLLPNGGNLDPAKFDDLASQITAAVQKTNEIRRVRRSAEAEAVWADAYKRWAKEAPGGLAGAIVARPEAQTLRLSVCYAALDGSDVIEVEHVQAALAVWRYCEASALYLFGDALGDPIADRLLQAISAAGDDGLDSTAQHAVFGRHVNATHLARARAELERRGLIVTTQGETGGRPRLVSKAVAR